MIRLASIKALASACAFLAGTLLFSACEGPSALDPAGGGTAAEADTSLNSTELGARWFWRGNNNQVAFVNVRPHDLSVQAGATAQLTVVARNRLGKRVKNASVVWSSSDSSVATVVNGRVRGVAAGTALLTALVNGRTDTARATVTQSAAPVVAVTISPDSLKLVVGQTLELAARVVASDSSELPDRPVTWSSSDRDVATVSSAGRVSAVAPGSADIVATVEGSEARATVSVGEPPVVAVDSVALSPASPTLKVGDEVQLSATLRAANGTTLTGRAITWQSSDEHVATVSSSGKVKAVGAGSAAISATSEGQTGEAAVTVSAPVVAITVASVRITPDSVSLTKGQSAQLSATPRDGSGKSVSGRSITWGSSRTSVATVSTSGKVTAVGAGSATITAKADGVAGTAKVVVTVPAPTVPPPATPEPPASETPSPPVSTPPPSSGGSTTERVGYYVSPTGSSSNQGTRSSPWDLASVLRGSKSQVGAGDTVWVLGGTYRGAFTSSVNGSSGSQVVIRAYPGERATIDGHMVVFGSYVTLQGLEVMSSSPSSSSYIGVDVFAPGAKIINMVIHDAGMSGVGLWNEAPNAELYGSIIYNNGTHTNLDHGVYFNGRSGTKYLINNIVFDNWQYGLHGYSGVSGEIQNLYLEGNVSFNNGSIGPLGSGPDIFVGGSRGTNITIKQNMTWRRNDGELALRLGDGQSGNSGLTLTGNYIVGKTLIGTWSGAQESGNEMLSSASPPTSGQRIFVRPNKYEAGRANVIVYNWGRAGSASADLSSVLRAGDHYEVREAQNFFGSPVASGTYSGGSISLPMSEVRPAALIGRSGGNPGTTGTVFHVFVVLRTD